MQYLIRAIKYFFYFAILTSLIVIALVLIGAVEGDISAIFRGGYSALWKIAAFYVIVAAVYPKVGFIRRRLYIDGDWTTVRNTVIGYMNDRRYELETESEDLMAFRCRGTVNRLSKMYEDRITLSKTSEGYVMEGLRKDVIRLAAGLEHRLTPQNEE